MTASGSFARLERVLDYRFQDQALLQRALTHRSAGATNNERMEFLGDSILGFAVSRALYVRHETANEGQLSRMRAQLVKKDTLAAVAGEIDLGHFLHLGPGELRSGGQSRDSILADALEAVIASVYLDGGLTPANELINRLLKTRIAAVNPQTQPKDPKTRLQELLQAQGHELPAYEVARVEGEAHAQVFSVTCHLDESSETTQGEGGSRRKAEQAAASAMLDRLAVQGQL